MYLIENLPPELWSRAVPGAPRRTVRMIAAHIHNARCMWIKMLGARHGIRGAADRRSARVVRPAELLRALSRSSDGIIGLIRLGMARGGAVPRAAWQNFPTDLVHFLNYFVAHEAHHRGQLCMLARRWGTGCPRASQRASGNGRSERENDPWSFARRCGWTTAQHIRTDFCRPAIVA